MAGLGKKTFTAGSVLTAAEVNGYLMEQAVMVFGGTAARSSAIPTPSEGMTSYLSDQDDMQVYTGASWVSTGLTAGTTTANYGWPIPASGSIASLGTAIDTTVAGLGSGFTLVKSQTVGSAVSSVVVTDAFNSSYDNYRIVFSGGTASNSPATDVFMKFGSTTTGYGHMLFYYGYAGGSGYLANANDSSFPYFMVATSNGYASVIDVLTPYAAKNTFVSHIGGTNGTGRYGGGYINNTTSYTEFTLTPAAGTLTGGTVKVYGYQN